MKKFLCLLPILCTLLCLSACSGHEQRAETPLRIAVISDIHFTGEEAYRYTGSFQAANDESGTGKQVELLPALLDAFLAQMESERPDVLLITGDNSFNGARVSHEALIDRLDALREAGVLILTLPGNHDVNGNALIFPDGEPEAGEKIDADEFAALYADYGYGGALSRDPGSLSYVYDCGRGVRIFMLDTCFRYGSVYGRVEADTMEWLARELAACRESGCVPVVAGHHNALVHNPMFAFIYTIDNGEELRALLEEYGVHFFLSGHLHPQTIAREDTFFDIATESFAVYPHRYGLLEIADGLWRYEAGETDVAAWAAGGGSEDPRLLDYVNYGRGFFFDQAFTQAERSFSNAVEDEALLAALCERFAEANLNYFMGTPLPAAEGELAETVAGLGGRSGVYLQTITDLPESLYAEGVYG